MVWPAIQSTLVALWTLSPLGILFALNWYLVAQYGCDKPSTTWGLNCERRVQVFLEANGYLPQGTLLTSTQVRLKLGVVQTPDPTAVTSGTSSSSPKLAHSFADIKDKYLLHPKDQGQRIPLQEVGSFQKLVTSFPPGTTLVLTTRSNAGAMAAQLKVKLVAKLDPKKSPQVAVLNKACPGLDKTYETLAVLEIPASKDLIYLVLKDTGSADWSECYKALGPKDLFPVILVQK